jgi:hypothetical protein
MAIPLLTLPVTQPMPKPATHPVMAHRESRSVPAPIETAPPKPVEAAPIATPLPTPIPTPSATPAASSEVTQATGSTEDWMAAAGIASSDYQYVSFISNKESGFCPTKWQGEYGPCPAYHGTPSSALVGYGVCQSTPGWKMAASGADWATNPVTQLKWCTTHAGEYGGWAGAYSFWLAHHAW